MKEFSQKGTKSREQGKWVDGYGRELGGGITFNFILS
jgi:hypothetical protein